MLYEGVMPEVKVQCSCTVIVTLDINKDKDKLWQESQELIFQPKSLFQLD